MSIERTQGVKHGGSMIDVGPVGQLSITSVTAHSSSLPLKETMNPYPCRWLKFQRFPWEAQ